MKKLRRFVIPWRIEGGLANIVAIFIPIAVRTSSLERKSSGVRRLILKSRFMRIQVSDGNELGNLGLIFWCVIGEFGAFSGVKLSFSFTM